MTAPARRQTLGRSSSRTVVGRGVEDQIDPLQRKKRGIETQAVAAAVLGLDRHRVRGNGEQGLLAECNLRRDGPHEADNSALCLEYPANRKMGGARKRGIVEPQAAPVLRRIVAEPEAQPSVPDRLEVIEPGLAHNRLCCGTAAISISARSLVQMIELARFSKRDFGSHHWAIR